MLLLVISVSSRSRGSSGARCSASVHFIIVILFYVRYVVLLLVMYILSRSRRSSGARCSVVCFAVTLFVCCSLQMFLLALTVLLFVVCSYCILKFIV